MSGMNNLNKLHAYQYIVKFSSNTLAVFSVINWSQLQNWFQLTQFGYTTYSNLLVHVCSYESRIIRPIPLLVPPVTKCSFRAVMMTWGREKYPLLLQQLPNIYFLKTTLTQKSRPVYQHLSGSSISGWLELKNIIKLYLHNISAKCLLNYDNSTTLITTKITTFWVF